MTRLPEASLTNGRSLPFVETAVSIENPQARISLSGTLTLPDTAGRHPGVVLVHGQGPLDRDMSFAHLRPFRTLAKHLAANGISSLRYDKRGVGESGGDFRSATCEDFADDVSAALRYLKGHEAIRPGSIGLLGQSEGAFIAPMVASTSDDVAFVVLLAPPALPGRENLSLSFAEFAQASPSNDLSVPAFRRLVDRLLDLVSLESPSPEDRAAAVRLAKFVAPHVINDRTNIILGGADVTGERFIDFLSSRCLQEMLESVPETFLSRLTCPVLALFADKDKQVPAQDNAAVLKRSLEAAGNRDYTIETVRGSNHLFQRCETGYPDEYFTIDHDISPDVLDRVSDWIAGIVRRANSG